LSDTLKGVFEKACADPLALVIQVHGKTAEQDQWYRLRRIAT